ncbi:MAG: accessory gene regulator B family protein [Oscillospiraceae bacterium]|nr:accessory gene regulator B family protein [Oscillospiraceae bacterium]
MIHNQASRLATGLINKRIIDENTHEVYTYGIELIISAFINILLMVIISTIFQQYYDWLLFLAAFIPIRSIAGGYHAGSHLNCIVVGTICFTILLLVCRLKINWEIVILTIAILSFSLILSFSPVEAHNKKLKEEQRKKNRKISICIGFANLIIAAAAYLFQGFSGILNIYFAGVFAASFSMLVVKMQIFKGRW